MIKEKWFLFSLVPPPIFPLARLFKGTNTYKEIYIYDIEPFSSF
jgi:hypothetical protein